jgi:hypothetical protein
MKSLKSICKSHRTSAILDKRLLQVFPNIVEKDCKVLLDYIHEHCHLPKGTTVVLVLPEQLV